MENEKNYFEILNAVDVSKKQEKKNGLTYLSWAWAWGEVKKRHPEASYIVYETTNPQGYICNYFTDGRYCWVKVGVTINGIEHIEQLPVMDYKNKSIPLDQVNSFDVNKTIQRALTKGIARHGLGLYIYAGEDLPESDEEEQQNESYHCENCGEEFKEVVSNGKKYTAKDLYEGAKNKYGLALCKTCGREYLNNKGGN
jgi:hypothetical protein